MGREPGKYGGVVRMLIGGQRDLRLMTLIGYQRLIGYDEKLNFQPDVLEDFEVEEDRIFTFKLRDGHKWSDGEPLTSEDLRYTWEDVLSNEDLSPGGLVAGAGRRRAQADLRGHRQADGPLLLGCAKPRFPAGDCSTAADQPRAAGHTT